MHIVCICTENIVDMIIKIWLTFQQMKNVNNLFNNLLKLKIQLVNKCKMSVPFF